MFWTPNIITLLFAWILQSIILAGFVWFDKYRNPSEKYTCWLIRGLRGFVFITFTSFSFLFIDTNIKILVFGIIGYGNLCIHLASILLTFILAAQIIIGVILVAPNRKGIATFFVVLGTFIFLWYIYIPSTSTGSLYILDSRYSILMSSLLFAILVGSSLALILSCCELILNKIKKDKEIEDRPFYDVTEKFKSLFNWKVNLLLWALITAELLLNLQGLSLLLWLTLLF
ncbi:MAG: hypothetical protein R6U96_05965 [Promethearchaeia archaeon]